MRKKNVAIVLAAGKGKRMGGGTRKQYLFLEDKPVLCYCLDVFERSFIDEVILVVGKEEQEFCKNEIVEKYGYKKVETIIEGGRERYHSVYNGIQAIDEAEIVYIHDGARPFISEKILEDLRIEVKNSRACVAAVPVKDTIKIVDSEGKTIDTLDRSKLWAVQTPQVFEFSIVKNAYDIMMAEENRGSTMHVTDDCMVVEKYTELRSKMVYSTYKNIKITTEEDLIIAKSFLLEKLV